MTNVYDYFYEKFGQHPSDKTLKDLPCDSPCGKDCVGAIDAASSLLIHVHAANGDSDPDFDQAVITKADDVVQTYWRG